MTLYITEKPSQVAALGDALRANQITDYKIVPLAGHLLELFNLKDYGIQKKWHELVSEKTIPFFPIEFKKQIKSDSKYLQNGKEVTYSYKDKFEIVKKEVAEADTIILATDPDNEGATLALEILEDLKALKKVSGMINMSKLDLTSLSKEVVITNKIPYLNMYAAGESRAHFDWLFGMNSTILATVKFGNGNLLNLGGVKLPTIRMVVERDREFETFKEIPFFTVTAKAKKDGKIFNVKIQGENERFDSEAQAQNAINSLKHNSNNYPSGKNIDFVAVVTDYAETQKSKAPGKPFSLTDLQAQANRKFKYTATQTLEISQKLYQDFKIQSYPRTDSNYYAEGEFEGVQATLKSLQTIDHFKNVIDSIDLENLPKRKIFDDTKIEAHTALSPLSSITREVFLDLSQEQKNVFSLVAARYVIQFMQDFKYLEIKGKASADDVNIIFSENITIENGYKSFAKDDEEKEEETAGERTIPTLQKGDSIEIIEDSIEIKKGSTKPRARFKEASLLQAMEKVHRFFDDKEVKEHLGDGGIGTPATRAKILEELKTAKNGDTPYLILNDKGELVSTEKARYLIATLPAEISSPILRANMEEKLNEIVKGNLTKSDYAKEIQEKINYICDIINSVEAKEMTKKSSSSTELKETDKTYRLGDKFIFKTFRDTKITKSNAEKILQGKKVKMKFKSKAGKEYEMLVFLKNDKLEAEFENTK